MSRWEIPITRLEPGLRALEPELLAAIQRVLGSGVFIGGPELEAFEAELACYLGVAACVGVNSGTDALIIALRALGVAPGDAVVVPAFGFIATAEAVSAVGAVPVFADIELGSFNLEPRALAQLPPGVKGIIAVHLFGQAAPMEALLAFAEERGAWVLEDAAQALGGSLGGRKLGSLGRAAAVSFFPSKNLGACGDGGAIATDDLELAACARQLRQHGARRKYESERLGHNSRLDALQAALLRVKLPRLDASVEQRRRAAARYDELLEGLPLERPRRCPGVQHTYHQYAVLLDAARRSAVQRGLAERGVEAVVHYPLPLHRQPVYAAGISPSLSGAPGLPAAEEASRRVLSLPFWPEISAAEQERVAHALRTALASSG